MTADLTSAVTSALDVVTAAVAGPLGYVPVLAAIGVLAGRILLAETRPPGPGSAPAPRRTGAVLSALLVLVAFAIVALRLTGFTR